MGLPICHLCQRKRRRKYALLFAWFLAKEIDQFLRLHLPKKKTPESTNKLAVNV